MERPREREREREHRCTQTKPEVSFESCRVYRSPVELTTTVNKVHVLLGSLAKKLTKLWPRDSRAFIREADRVSLGTGATRSRNVEG